MAFATAITVGLATPASSQDMSASEAAAFAERPPTPEERERWLEECRINVVPDETRGIVVLSEAFQGRVVRLPSMRVLVVIWVVYNGPAEGTFEVQASKPLPFGGIAGFDLCGQITITETLAMQKRNDVAMYRGFRLRRKLDLQSDYPTVNSAIRERGMLYTSPSTRYVEVLTEEPSDFSKWLRENKQELPWLHPSHQVIGLSDRMFVPMR